MDTILLKLTEIEVELENLEPSRKEELLDLIDAFRASLIIMLKPDKEDEGDPMDDNSGDRPVEWVKTEKEPLKVY